MAGEPRGEKISAGETRLRWFRGRHDPEGGSDDAWEKLE